MKANIVFEKEGLEKAFKLHYDTKHPIRSRLMLFMGLLTLLLGFFLFYIDFPKEPSFIKHLIVLSGVAYILLFFYRKKQLYARAANQKTFQGHFVFELNKKGLVFSQADKKSVCEWAKMIDIVQDEHHFLFYFGASNFYILPKKALNESQIQEAKECINTYYGK
jgi:hypothetical protein